MNPTGENRYPTNLRPGKPKQKKGRNGPRNNNRGLGRMEVLGPNRPYPAHCPPLSLQDEVMCERIQSHCWALWGGADDHRFTKILLHQYFIELLVLVYY
jgi:hypothetical protein